MTTRNGGKGRDTYDFKIGGGAITVVNSSGEGAAQDTVEIDSGTGIDRLLFEKSGKDLKVSILGTSDSLTVKDWGLHNQLTFKLGGKRLSWSGAEELADKMKGMTPLSAGMWGPADKMKLDDIVTANSLRSGAFPTVRGGPGNDWIYGTGTVSHLIDGLGGDDVLSGGLAGDALNGGAGADRLFGNEGNDTLHGNDENDVLYGGDGRDFLYGRDGDDKLYGGDGHDELFGNPGNDTLRGGDGNDIVKGGGSSAGDDKLYGDAGNDRLNGGPGDDWLWGGAGGDKLLGGAGNDWASYSEAGSGVVADLFNVLHRPSKPQESGYLLAPGVVPHPNEGEAAGDRYHGIETFRVRVTLTSCTATAWRTRCRATAATTNCMAGMGTTGWTAARAATPSIWAADRILWFSVAGTVMTRWPPTASTRIPSTRWSSAPASRAKTCGSSAVAPIGTI